MMSVESHVMIRARCTVVPKNEYPRKCPYISDGYRPNLLFRYTQRESATSTFCIGTVEIPQGQLYAGESADVTVDAIVDAATAERLERGVQFELREADWLIARCIIVELLEQNALS